MPMVNWVLLYNVYCLWLIAIYGALFAEVGQSDHNAHLGGALMGTLIGGVMLLWSPHTFLGLLHDQWSVSVVIINLAYLGLRAYCA